MTNECANAMPIDNQTDLAAIPSFSFVFFVFSYHHPSPSTTTEATTSSSTKSTTTTKATTASPSHGTLITTFSLRSWWAIDCTFRPTHALRCWLLLGTSRQIALSLRCLWLRIPRKCELFHSNEPWWFPAQRLEHHFHLFNNEASLPFLFCLLSLLKKKQEKQEKGKLKTKTKTKTRKRRDQRV
jgi:hypothetical protein